MSKFLERGSRSLSENKKPTTKPGKLVHFPANFCLIALLLTKNDRKNDLNFLISRYGLYSRTGS